MTFACLRARRAENTIDKGFERVLSYFRSWELRIKKPQKSAVHELSVSVSSMFGFPFFRISLLTFLLATFGGGCEDAKWGGDEGVWWGNYLGTWYLSSDRGASLVQAGKQIWTGKPSCR
jgi:hypothetical protein